MNLHTIPRTSRGQTILNNILTVYPSFRGYYRVTSDGQSVLYGPQIDFPGRMNNWDDSWFDGEGAQRAAIIRARQ